MVISSEWIRVSSALCTYYVLSRACMRSVFVCIESPNNLSMLLMRAYRAATYVRYVEAVYLSLIISALFSEMPLCISEHMRPYYYIVKVLRSTPLDNITY